MKAAKAMVKGEIPDERIPPVPQSKTSPNTRLDVACSYCEFRKLCWPEVRTFLYANGPLHLVAVVNTPQVYEVKDES